MAKIIIEVSDDVIRQNASAESLKAKADEKGVNPMKLMYDMIAFGVIVGQLKKGVNEFRVSRDELDEDLRSIFDRNLADVLIVAGLAIKKEEETKEN